MSRYFSLWDNCVTSPFLFICTSLYSSHFPLFLSTSIFFLRKELTFIWVEFWVTTENHCRYLNTNVLTSDGDRESTGCLGTRVSCECVRDLGGLTDLEEPARLMGFDDVKDLLIGAISRCRFSPGNLDKCCTRLLGYGSHSLIWTTTDSYSTRLPSCKI